MMRTQGQPLSRWGTTRPAPARCCQTAPAERDRGRPPKTERPHPPQAGVTQSIIMSPGLEQ